MTVNFTARHTQLTPEIKKLCERRLKSIEKFLGSPIESDIIISMEKNRYIVEVNVRTKGMNLNSEEETHDVYASLGAAFDHVERQAKKERSKMRERKRRKPKDLLAFSPPKPEEREQLKRVFRSKDYYMKPLSIEEAVLQFETSREEVFVFRKVDTEKWAVLFRRKDGNFGLIEPE